MEEQKKQIIQFVKEQKEKGYTISATLKDMGIKRPTYYSCDLFFMLLDKYAIISESIL